MSLFGKLFGKKPVPPPKPPVMAPPASSPPADPRENPNLIRMFDEYGREVFITKEEWRKNILPANIQSQWNNPDQLYRLILDSLNDGFRTDVVEASRQLYRIDTQPVRGVCVWGIVLMEEGRLDEAEQVFRDFIARHGEQGVVLTNLAKVYAKRKDHTKAEEILWRGLEVDPNQDNAVGWYEVTYRERSGQEAGLAALRRIAALPGSWRAQLWLARTALQSRNSDQALVLYHECLARVGKPVPADLLMQMSGDLGNAGCLPEILQLAEPYFDAATHGLQVGNNLIKAHVDLGQLEAAQRLLDQLYALKRPDWKESLDFWDTEIARARVAATPTDEKAPLKTAMLTIEGPVWLKPASPAAELFPAKTPDGPIIAFLGSSAEMATNSKRVQHQMSDTPGRLSRALPLFLAEQVEFGSQARVHTLVPRIVNGPGGFVVCGVAWDDGDAAAYARRGDLKSDFVVISHLKTQTEPWTLELRLVRAIDGKCLETLSASFPSAQPQQGIPSLARQLLQALSRQAEVELQTPSPLYRAPVAENFPNYLLRLEQLLAVRCAGMEGINPGFLNGEREIIDGNLLQCLDHPDNVSTRILLAHTLVAMKKARPDILPEFKDKLTLLQKEHPLQEPAHSVVQRMFNEVWTS